MDPGFVGLVGTSNFTSENCKFTAIEVNNYDNAINLWHYVFLPLISNGNSTFCIGSKVLTFKAYLHVRFQSSISQ